MPVLRCCSGAVIRCFKRVEHFADWITGAAGPVFVALCWGLISLGGITFFDVVARDLSTLATILLIPVLLLVPLNLYGQYFLVTHVPPGYPSPLALALSPKPITNPKDKWLIQDPDTLWAAERWGWRARSQRLLTGQESTQRRVRRCRKCTGPKPERTHHCSVCRRCILCLDHHCPWINACVGLHNQRHFVLFMVWLSIGCWTVVATGFHQFLDSFAFNGPWSGYSPRLAFTLIYVLCLAIGVAVPVLASWHVHMVSKGETSIESHDNSYLEGRARAEGLIYLNPYDLGRRKNLEGFFNIGPTGYPAITLLFPLAIPPATNGWTYPRRSLPTESSVKLGVKLHTPELADGLIENGSHGHEGKYVMGDDEGLTDDEEGGGGWMPD